MTDTLWLIASLVAGFISVVVAIGYYIWVNRQDPGTEQAKKVAAWIRQGAISYLRKLYLALLLVAAVLAVIIAIVFGLQRGASYGVSMAIAFIAGAILSAVAG